MEKEKAVVLVSPPLAYNSSLSLSLTHTHYTWVLWLLNQRRRKKKDYPLVRVGVYDNAGKNKGIWHTNACKWGLKPRNRCMSCWRYGQSLVRVCGCKLRHKLGGGWEGTTQGVTRRC